MPLSLEGKKPGELTISKFLQQTKTQETKIAGKPRKHEVQKPDRKAKSVNRGQKYNKNTTNKPKILKGEFVNHTVVNNCM